MYDIFISHAWKYDEHYYGIESFLDKAHNDLTCNFTYRNYSVPKHDPLVDPNSIIGHKKLISLLDEQIRQCSVFIVVAAMYSKHRHWIQVEIEIAKKYNKKILAIKPWGQERIRNEQVVSSNPITGSSVNQALPALEVLLFCLFLKKWAQLSKVIFLKGLLVFTCLFVIKLIVTF